MEYTPERRAALILEACMSEKSRDPIRIFNSIASRDFVRIHGPEHHILDGACLLTAYANAGGTLELPAALEALAREGARMPGATCGLWGVCGACCSIGAALAVIDGTGPLTPGGDWGDHMHLTSRVLDRLASTGGPRCCKRSGSIALITAAEYVRERYGVPMEISPVKCAFHGGNRECIGDRCPFFPH